LQDAGNQALNHMFLIVTIGRIRRKKGGNAQYAWLMRICRILSMHSD